MAVTTRSGALFRDTITFDHDRADIVLGDAYVDITQASALYSIATDPAPQLTAALLPDVVTAPANAAGSATIPTDIINGLQSQAGGTRGQLFFGTDGLLVDKRIAYFNEGTTGPEFRIIDNASGNNLRGFSVENMVVDSAAGFYYAIVSDGTGGQSAFLIRGAISGGPVTVLADYATALGASNPDPLVLSLAIDPVNSRLYVGIQENTGMLSPQAQAGIRQYTYNGSTGAVTDNGFLVTAQSSGKPAEGAFTLFDPNDIEINSVTNTLFFTEFAPGVPSVGLFRLSLSSPNTIVQVVSQAQFPDSGANGFIYDVEADSSTNITYFTTFSQRPSPDPAYNAAQNQIWYVTNASTATNATAVALSLFDTNGTTNFRTVNTVFYPTSLIFDQSTRQLYVASEQLGGTNDDRIYVFQLNAAGTQGTLVNTIFPSFGSSSVNLTALAFNSLPTFSTFNGTATAALEQSAAVIATAAGSTVADDGRLNAATVQITGGTFTSTEAGVNNDNLAVGAGLQTSGLVAGTNITVSYTAGTRTLQLSGYDTLANYQTVLASVRYFSAGNNPTNYGANTTRTLTWTVNDGAINLTPNSLATTTTTLTVTGINDAPTAMGLQGDIATTTEPAGLGSALPAVKIDSGQNATLADLDNLNFNGGSIRFAITSGLVAAQDRLNIDTAAATTVTVAGATVSVGGTAIGTFTGGGAGGADLVVTFNASATPALVQTLIRAIDFANTGGDNPTAGARTITTTLNDGGGTANGGVSTLVITSNVSVVAVDDPSVAVADTGGVNENATVSIAVLTNDTDPDTVLNVNRITQINGAGLTIGSPVTLASGATTTLNADGTFTYNPNGRFNSLIDAATAAATGATNSSATDSFTYTLSGGSSTTVTVTINGVAGAGDRLGGDAGNNTINGTPLDDFFDLSQGGNDTINGGNGNDAFLFGAAFTAADTVDGGVGTNDQIGLQGNYSGANALTLGATTITNVEVIAVLPGFSYSITTVDANIAAGQNLTFFGTSLGAGDNFTVNASAETNGTVRIYGGLGTDTFTGGAGDDGFYFGPGRFNPATDTVNGGAGTNDQVALDGNYTATISGTQLQNVEVLVLLRGVTGDLANYNITLADDLIGTGQTFTVFGLAVETGFTLNATAETNGNVTVFGGSGADTISTGSGADRIFGGGGADILNGGAGADTFVYDAVSQSTGATYDRITGFVSSTDKLDFNFTVTGVDATVGAGTLSTASFDANLAAAIGAGQLAANHAVLFQANAGTLSGLTFLVVDANGVAGYQAGADYVIQLVTPPASLVTGDFI
ncbi:MAG: VCBS domain-containing protein [Sphingomonas sp.]|uniref:beta strand repeat-containing protein n=1 Tax=Sphingomonas sp. TaxID=28214 RepID=UPI0025CC0970|nr:Ig-like domain-containing protein [Sphingomonas sp.]MBY0285435.1 VCBS domain-containing protein [Sphingomonas sp.]